MLAASLDVSCSTEHGAITGRRRLRRRPRRRPRPRFRFHKRSPFFLWGRGGLGLNARGRRVCGTPSVGDGLWLASRAGALGLAFAIAWPRRCTSNLLWATRCRPGRPAGGRPADSPTASFLGLYAWLVRSMLALVAVVFVAACSRDAPPAPAPTEATFVAPPAPKQDARPGVTFVVSPMDQTVASIPDGPLKGLWCVQGKPELMATIANHSSSAFYLPAADALSVRIWKYQHDGKYVMPIRVRAVSEGDRGLARWQSMTLLRQGRA